jgi:ABC-type Na+ efflux pump permease subunit
MLNPVLARELKERMRRRRAAVVVTLYLLVLAGIMWAVYQAAQSSGTITRCVEDRCFTQPNALVLAAAGRPVFHWLLFFVLMLVCFIVPGVTSGSIASERERQTLVPLQVTLLSPLSILLGKLLASLAFTVLLLVATLPLMSVAYAIGGVSFGEIVRGLAMVIAVAASIGSLSIGCSAAFRRVQAATVSSYGVVFLLAVGTLIVFGLNAMIHRGERLNAAYLVGNPFVATADALGGSTEAGSALQSPFVGMQQMLEAARRSQDAPDRVEMQANEPVDVVVDAQAPAADRGFWGPVPFWVVTMGAYLLLAAAAMRFAARRITAPGRAST